jgi:hypothetical protein
VRLIWFGLRIARSQVFVVGKQVLLWIGCHIQYFNPSRSVLLTTLGIIFDESNCELTDDLLGGRSLVVEVDSSDC